MSRQESLPVTKSTGLQQSIRTENDFNKFINNPPENLTALTLQNCWFDFLNEAKLTQLMSCLSNHCKQLKTLEVTQSLTGDKIIEEKVKRKRGYPERIKALVDNLPNTVTDLKLHDDLFFFVEIDNLRLAGLSLRDKKTLKNFTVTCLDKSLMLNKLIVEPLQNAGVTVNIELIDESSKKTKMTDASVAPTTKQQSDHNKRMAAFWPYPDKTFAEKINSVIGLLTTSSPDDAPVVTLKVLPSLDGWADIEQEKASIATKLQSVSIEQFITFVAARLINKTLPENIYAELLGLLTELKNIYLKRESYYQQPKAQLTTFSFSTREAASIERKNKSKSNNDNSNKDEERKTPAPDANTASEINSDIPNDIMDVFLECCMQTCLSKVIGLTGVTGVTFEIIPHQQTSTCKITLTGEINDIKNHEYLRSAMSAIFEVDRTQVLFHEKANIILLKNFPQTSKMAIFNTLFSWMNEVVNIDFSLEMLLCNQFGRELDYNTLLAQVAKIRFNGTSFVADLVVDNFEKSQKVNKYYSIARFVAKTSKTSLAPVTVRDEVTSKAMVVNVVVRKTSEPLLKAFGENHGPRQEMVKLKDTADNLCRAAFQFLNQEPQAGNDILPLEDSSLWQAFTKLRETIRAINQSPLFENINEQSFKFFKRRGGVGCQFVGRKTHQRRIKLYPVAASLAKSKTRRELSPEEYYQFQQLDQQWRDRIVDFASQILFACVPAGRVSIAHVPGKCRRRMYGENEVDYLTPVLIQQPRHAPSPDTIFTMPYLIKAFTNFLRKEQPIAGLVGRYGFIARREAEVKLFCQAFNIFKDKLLDFKPSEKEGKKVASIKRDFQQGCLASLAQLVAKICNAQQDPAATDPKTLFGFFSSIYLNPPQKTQKVTLKKITTERKISLPRQFQNQILQACFGSEKCRVNTGADFLYFKGSENTKSYIQKIEGYLEKINRIQSARSASQNTVEPNNPHRFSYAQQNSNEAEAAVDSPEDQNQKMQSQPKK
jgi:hypothetical protein